MSLIKLINGRRGGGPSPVTNTMLSRYFELTNASGTEQTHLTQFHASMGSLLDKLLALYLFIGDDMRVNFVHPEVNDFAFYLTGSGISKTTKGATITGTMNTHISPFLCSGKPNLGAFFYSQGIVSAQFFSDQSQFAISHSEAGTAYASLGVMSPISFPNVNKRGLQLFQRTGLTISGWDMTSKLGEATMDSNYQMYVADTSVKINPSGSSIGEISAVGIFEAFTEAEITLFRSALGTLLTNLNRL